MCKCQKSTLRFWTKYLCDYVIEKSESQNKHPILHGSTDYHYREVAIMVQGLTFLTHKMYKMHTVKNSGVDASTEPPNQTANLWIGWLSTLTSTGCDCGLQIKEIKKKGECQTKAVNYSSFS